jgi:hypothetical protein
VSRDASGRADLFVGRSKCDPTPHVRRSTHEDGASHRPSSDLQGRASLTAPASSTTRRY